MAVFKCNFYSTALIRNVDVTVFLPETDAIITYLNNMNVVDAHPRKEYKTIYLLHGMMDDHNSWINHTNVINYAQKAKVAVVMPSAENSWYCDTGINRHKYFDFINYEIPAWAESVFPLKKGRENRFIAGLSMGGYGAVKGIFSAPEQYSKCGIFSGVTDIVAMSESSKKEHEENPNAPTDMVRYIFGRGIKSGDDEDLFYLAEKLAKSEDPKPDFFVGCGTDDSLYEPLCKFRAHLKNLGYNVSELDMPGYHEWMVWDKLVEAYINWLDL